MGTDRQVIAITGGASGIGRATAYALAATGARLAIGDVDIDGARQVAERCLAIGADRAEAIPVDVGDASAFADFLDVTEARLGVVDVLINSAGVMWVGSFDDEPADWVERQVRVNLLGSIHGVRQAVLRMRQRRQGHIVTVASAASLLAPSGEATYTATKHGIYGYLKSVRRELRRTGIRLSVVMPAVVDTPLAAGTSPGGTPLLTPERVAEAILGVIRRPRFEVTVPRTAALLHAVQRASPQLVRDALDSFFVPNQLIGADPAKRAHYQTRISNRKTTNATHGR
jgi:hypothetical protein